MVKYPCSKCHKAVRKNHKALLCTSCTKWAHIVCEGIPKCKYDDTNESFENWQCTVCALKQFSFWEQEDIFPVETRLGCSYLPNITQNSTSNVDNRYNILCDISKKKGIKLAHLNIISLRNKVTDVKQFLMSTPFDILGLSKTWLNEDFSNHMISIDLKEMTGLPPVVVE